MMGNINRNLSNRLFIILSSHENISFTEHLVLEFNL